MENHGTAGCAADGPRASEHAAAFPFGQPQAAFSGDFSRFKAGPNSRESLTFLGPALPGRASEPASLADELRIYRHQTPAQKPAGRKE